MKQVVIMPGGFHPFHAGHFALYQQAQKAFPGADVYVAATNDTSTRPFPFELKEKLARLAGVAPGHFVQVKSPFQAREITADLDPANTQLIFVRSEKDANKPPQAGGVKKNGEPAYLQPLKGQTSLAPMAQHAYMAYLPTVEFGPGMTSATEIRTAWPTLNERRKTALVMSLYPKTQKNPKLAASVVKMLDMAILGEELNEFDPNGGGGNIPRGPKTPSRGPWDDSGEDPYQLRRYNRSADFFDQFDSDGVDKQKFDKATGEYEGYYLDRDAASGITQIAYFKFDDPAKIGDNDPGIGWYYEPIDESVAEAQLDESGNEYILYINNKPAAKYTDVKQAEQDLYLVKSKVPTAKFEIKQEVCNMVSVPVGLKEALLKFASNVSEAQLDEKCWDTHKQVGMKRKGNRMVPDCVPRESIDEDYVDEKK